MGSLWYRKNAADSNDFYKGILPSGTVRFLTGQSKRTIKYALR